MENEKDMDLIDKAHAAAQRLEEANKIHAELIKKQEALDARRILGGQSSAGEPAKPELTEKEKIDIGMKQYFKGTAIEGVLK